MVTLPDIREIWFHRDYDGLVAAALLAACLSPGRRGVRLHGLEFVDNRAWPRSTLPDGTAVLDFPHHPDAVLWIDHHDTAFSEAGDRERFVGGPFHLLDVTAESCPQVVVRQPWFRPQVEIPDLDAWVSWSRIIDAARYESAAQANALSNPHVLLAWVIPACRDDRDLATIVEAIGSLRAAEVVALAPVAALAERLFGLDQKLRPALTRATGLQGSVAFLDQSFTDLPFRRYLPYEVHPDAKYAVGIYRSSGGYVVSLGENPWNRTGRIHLGQLCRAWGGGGRPSTAGVPVASLVAARQVAREVVHEVNRQLGEERVFTQRPARTLAG